MKTESLRNQADILNSVAKKFFGEYAWIEKVEMHAFDVGSIAEESVRRMHIAADEIDRLAAMCAEYENRLKTISTAVNMT